MHMGVELTDEVCTWGWTAFSGQAHDHVICRALQNTYQLTNVFSVEYLTATVHNQVGISTFCSFYSRIYVMKPCVKSNVEAKTCATLKMDHE